MNIEQQSHFAAYYNMARRNLFVTLQHISKVAHLNATYNDSQESAIYEMMVVQRLINGNAEEKVTIERLVYKHLPFMRAIVENRRCIDNARIEADNIKDSNPTHKNKVLVKNTQLLADALYDWCIVLTFFRDKYTHWIFNDSRSNDPDFIKKEKRVVRDLNFLFTASARVIKERFSLTTQLEFLTKGRYKTEYIRDKEGKFIKGDNGRPLTEAVIDTRFFYSLQDKDNRLSHMGVIFLVCQFIEKKYATMLFDKQGYKGYGVYQNHGEESRRYLREVFSAHRIILPRNRMDIERIDTMLAMDMLNELHRCPAELFDVISPCEQNKFRIVSEVTGEEVLLRRSSDRFATLAMEYFDRTHALNNIRFQVSLGKYRYKFYNKKCIDGHSHMRTLQKELNGFGRIHEINNARIAQWGKLIRHHDDVTSDTPETAPYVTDHNAQYVINGNRIAMYFNSNRGNKLRSGYYLPEIQEDKAPCLQPTCLMSIYELPAMLFHYLLTKESNTNATEKIITDTVDRYHRFFSDIANGTLSRTGNASHDFKHIFATYGIARTDIPRELQDYFTGKHRDGFNSLARRRIIKMIQENDISLTSFRKKRDEILLAEMKYGKRNYQELRPGSLAATLAQDIVKFIPSRGNKPTGKNYSVLQATIATFDTYHDTEAWDKMEEILIELGAMGWENEADNHPFIDQLFDLQINNTIEFYNLYMEKRGEYLRSVLNNDNLDQLPFLHATRTRWHSRNEEFYRNLAARYASQPIDLPRGLYLHAIKEALSNISELVPDLALPQCNVTHLILRYMQAVKGDESQPFYFIARHYDCLSEKGNYLTLAQRKDITMQQALNQYIERKRASHKKNNSKSENDNNKFNQAKESEKFARLYRSMENNERTLRRYRVQDMLLYLAACDIINVTEADFGHKLNMIADDSNTGFFDYVMPQFEIDITLRNGRTCKLTEHDLKLKNYGDFFRFIYDSRVQSLLNLSSITEIECDILEQELVSYDECRPHVFETILSIEKEIVESNILPPDSRITFAKVLAAMTNRSDTEKEVIRLIRNAFSHNSYARCRIEGINYNNVPSVATSLKDLLDYMK